VNTRTVPARIIRVVDGDTLDVELDLGWHITYRAKIRLARINAPELNTADGRAALTYVVNALTYLSDALTHSVEWRPITVVSHSLDKYGRVLGDVKWTDRDGTAYDLADALVTSGHAVPVRTTDHEE
jgi:endonuclease YncB( thermonuclease family)